MRESNKFVQGAADRNKLLHISLDGWIIVAYEQQNFRVHCNELSLSHMLIEAPIEWQVGTEIELKAIEINGKEFELEGYAVVTKIEQKKSFENLGLALIDYIDFDAVAKNCLQSVYSFLISLRNRDERLAMRFNWAFNDVAQLVAVCKTLLAEVDVSSAWTDSGPSELARAYLAGKKQDFSEPQQIMLETVWKLWCGSLDLPEPVSTLPDSARGALVALRKAIARGPTGINEWLQVEWR
ncbi:MAG: hypothetical protein JW841_16680 [Deltaproteobacteria bacterium]|nr:hypothetical protein [Deltaproteobacteria bacterium]